MDPRLAALADAGAATDALLKEAEAALAELASLPSARLWPDGDPRGTKCLRLAVQALAVSGADGVEVSQERLSGRENQ
jgi:hypothetical protein